MEECFALKKGIITYMNGISAPVGSEEAVCQLVKANLYNLKRIEYDYMPVQDVLEFLQSSNALCDFYEEEGVIFAEPPIVRSDDWSDKVSKGTRTYVLPNNNVFNLLQYVVSKNAYVVRPNLDLRRGLEKPLQFLKDFSYSYKMVIDPVRLMISVPFMDTDGALIYTPITTAPNRHFSYNNDTFYFLLENDDLDDEYKAIMEYGGVVATDKGNMHLFYIQGVSMDWSSVHICDRSDLDNPPIAYLNTLINMVTDYSNSVRLIHGFMNKFFGKSLAKFGATTVRKPANLDKLRVPIVRSVSTIAALKPEAISELVEIVADNYEALHATAGVFDALELLSKILGKDVYTLEFCIPLLLVIKNNQATDEQALYAALRTASVALEKDSCLINLSLMYFRNKFYRTNPERLSNSANSMFFGGFYSGSSKLKREVD